MPAASSGPARSSAVALLIALALMMKLLVPTGWMPAVGPGGVTLILCASAGSPPSAEMAAAAARLQAALAGTDEGGHEPLDGSADQPCTYAGLAFAWTMAAAVPAMPMPLAAVLPRRTEGTVAIGRGLAAPPPPARGPPATA